MVSPWSYPLYRIDNSSVIEVVIEVSNTSEILNICPRLTSLGLTMTYFDTYKNSFIILSSIVFATFAILLFSIFSIDPRRFRGYFLTGLLFTAYFFINNCWIIGYMERITNVIPMFLLTYISRPLVLACWGLAIWSPPYRSPKVFPKNLPHVYRAAPWRCPLFLRWHCSSGFRCFRRNRTDPSAVPRDQLADQNLAGTWCALYWRIFIPSGLPVPANWNVCKLYLQLFWSARKNIVSASGVHHHFRLSDLYGKANSIRNSCWRIPQNLLTLEKKLPRIRPPCFRGQIQPHFLYNTLTTIQRNVLYGSGQAADLIVHFRDICAPILILWITRTWFLLKKNWNISKIIFIYRIPGLAMLVFEKDITVTEFQIPPLSVQPLIENAKIRHPQKYNHGNPAGKTNCWKQFW